MKLTLEQLKSMIREQVEEVRASRLPPDALGPPKRQVTEPSAEQKEAASAALEAIKVLEAEMITIEDLGLSEVDSLLVHNNIKSIKKVLQRVVADSTAERLWKV